MLFESIGFYQLSVFLNFFVPEKKANISKKHALIQLGAGSKTVNPIALESPIHIAPKVDLIGVLIKEQANIAFWVLG